MRLQVTPDVLQVKAFAPVCNHWNLSHGGIQCHLKLLKVPVYAVSASTEACMLSNAGFRRTLTMLRFLTHWGSKAHFVHNWLVGW